MPNESAKADPLCETLLFRSEVLRETRAYYHRHGFAEVETPVVIDAPAIEEYIEAPRTAAGGRGGFFTVVSGAGDEASPRSGDGADL